MVVLVILLKVGLKIEDPGRHQRNLRLWAACVTGVTLVLLEDRLTLNLGNRHLFTPSHAILWPQPRHGAVEGVAVYGTPVGPAMKIKQAFFPLRSPKENATQRGKRRSFKTGITFHAQNDLHGWHAVECLWQ